MRGDVHLHGVVADMQVVVGLLALRIQDEDDEMSFRCSAGERLQGAA